VLSDNGKALEGISKKLLVVELRYNGRNDHNCYKPKLTRQRKVTKALNFKQEMKVKIGSISFSTKESIVKELQQF
jgi:hypothetical protein